MFRFVLPFLISLTSVVAAEKIADPFQNIETFTLENGMRVFLNPGQNAKTIQVKVRVSAGSYSEEVGKSGAAHLLEHYLFTNENLGTGMSYLEAIKEKQGEANAETASKYTAYYATLPPRHTDWIFEVFSKMLFHRKFEEEKVEFAKKPVFLEIGDPNWLDYAGFAFFKLFPNFGHTPDFWEISFNDREPNRNRSVERVETVSLTAADITAFYENYDPGNMIVFVAGNFDSRHVRQLLQKYFAPAPRLGKKGWKDPPLKAEIGNYKRTEGAIGVAKIRVGTKVSDITFEEEVSSRIYMEYLAHRLMKLFRNMKGDTYTAVPDYDLQKGSGRFFVKFETSDENYYKNLRTVRSLIDSETRNGELTEAQFKEAMDLFSSNFIVEGSSGSLMNTIESLSRAERAYGRVDKNSYQIFYGLNYERLKENLKHVFKKDMGYESLEEPPLLFRYEAVLLVILSITGWMWLLKKLASRAFKHNEVRWVRKIRYPPVYTLQLGALFMAAFLCTFISDLLFGMVPRIGFLNSTFVLSDYLPDVVGVGLYCAAIQLVFGLIPRKLMVVGDKFFIKSLGMSSRVYLLRDIEKIEVKKVWQIFLQPKLLLRNFFRMSFFDLLLWRSGILIHLKDGRSLYVQPQATPTAAEELRGFVNNPEPRVQTVYS